MNHKSKNVRNAQHLPSFHSISPPSIHPFPNQFSRMKDYSVHVALFFLTSSPFLHDSLSMVFALGPSSSQITTLEGQDLMSNPFRCTVSANDKESCILITHCVWCQGDGLPGICVSEKQEKALIHKIPHVKCFHEEVVDTVPLFLRGGEAASAKMNIAPIFEEKPRVPFDPICLNAATQGSLDDDRKICDTTKDSQGEMCRWCDAAGIFQLCLSNEQAQMASSYLHCDLFAAGERKMTKESAF